MQVSVHEVKNSSQRKEFIALPWKIYNSKDHPQWVPPLRIAVKESLDTDRNPFYKQADIQLFLAKKNGSTVGRIAAIDNRLHNQFHNENIGFYGFFECSDDQDVANALFNEAALWLKKRGGT